MPERVDEEELADWRAGQLAALTIRAPVAVADQWEIWRSPAGETIRSFAIITTQPNELCAELHNRMPAVLKPEAWPVWLGEQPADVPQLKALLAPYPFRGHDLLAGDRAGEALAEVLGVSAGDIWLRRRNGDWTGVKARASVLL